MAKTEKMKLWDDTIVSFPPGLSDEEKARHLIDTLDDDKHRKYKDHLHEKFKIDKKTSGWGSTIGATGGGGAGAWIGGALGAPLGPLGVLGGAAIGGAIGAGLGGAGGDVAEQKALTDYDNSIDTRSAIDAAKSEALFGALGGPVAGAIGRGGKAGVKLLRQTGDKISPFAVGGRAGRSVADTVANAPVVKLLGIGDRISDAAKKATDLPLSVRQDVSEKAFKDFNIDWDEIAKTSSKVGGQGNPAKVIDLLASKNPADVNDGKRILERIVNTRAGTITKNIKAGDTLNEADLVKLGLSKESVGTLLDEFGKSIGRGRSKRIIATNADGQFPTREITDGIKKALYSKIYADLAVGNVSKAALPIGVGSALDNEAPAFNKGGKLSNKIGLLRSEGYPQDQAVAIAHSYKKRGMLK